ncbi:MAG: 3'(2'),5'-bisphosphate nucleotidase CysQ [Bacteroidota bacterium]
MTDLLALALDAARAGGREVLTYYGQSLPHDVKADDSPLTQADLASHHAIVDRLTAARPDIPVLSEESRPEAVAGRKGWPRFWCVDPLDGTKEFIKATTGEFTVNIALVEGSEPVLGVVHVPVLGVTYYAADGLAWKQLEDAEPVAISTRIGLGDTLTVVASRDHAGPEVAAFIEHAEADGRTVEAASMGSSLKFCLIAEGVADVYPRTVPTFEWDTAAAQAIVEAAGGGVSTRDGQRLRYNKDDLRNPAVFAWGEASLPWRRWINS